MLKNSFNEKLLLYRYPTSYSTVFNSKIDVINQVAAHKKVKVLVGSAHLEGLRTGLEAIQRGSKEPLLQDLATRNKEEVIASLNKGYYQSKTNNALSEEAPRMRQAPDIQQNLLQHNSNARGLLTDTAANSYDQVSLADFNNFYVSPLNISRHRRASISDFRSRSTFEEEQNQTEKAKQLITK